MKSITTKLLAVSPELSQTNDQSSASSPTKHRWFGKKALILTVVVAATIILIAFFVPQGSAVIPLNVDYTVGEKMVYDTTMTSTFQYDNSPLPTTGISQLPKSSSINMTQVIEVTGFDGEYYTLNHTMTISTNNKPLSISLTEKMNKTGYSAYLFNLGSTQEEIPNNGFTSTSYLAQLLSKPEVKVGDSVTIPYPAFPSNLSSSISVTGDLKMTFKGFEDLTVPAGTYKVFRIDITSNNLKMEYKSPLSSDINFTAANISISMNLNYQVYLEYGTMRQIKTNMQETVSTQSATIDYGMTMNMDMILTEHIKP